MEIISVSKGIKQFLKRMIHTASEAQHASIGINDKTDIESFIANANNTFLVSFPHTGSHWLRMLMVLCPSFAYKGIFPLKERTIWHFTFMNSNWMLRVPM